MKVRCIDNSAWADVLSNGAIYTVVNQYDGPSAGKFSGKRYRLAGILEAPFIERFEIVSECPCDVKVCIKHRKETNGT